MYEPIEVRLDDSRQLYGAVYGVRRIRDVQHRATRISFSARRRLYEPKNRQVTHDEMNYVRLALFWGSQNLLALECGPHSSCMGTF